MTTEDIFTIVAFLGVASLVTHFIASGSRAYRPVVTTFAAHIFIGFAIYQSAGLFAPDAIAYDAVARNYVAYWNHEITNVPSFAAGKEGWVIILAWIYYVFGHIPLLGIVLNAVVSTVSTSLVMGTTDRLGYPQRATVAGWLSLLPQFLIWSSLLVREAIAGMLTIALLWAASGFVARRRWQHTVWLALTFLGLLWIRGNLAVFIVVSVFLGIIASTRRIPPSLLLGALAMTVMSSSLLNRIGAVSEGSTLQNINVLRGAMAESSFETTSYTNPVSVIQALPTTLPRALFGPYPWDLPNLSPLALLDVAPWLLLLWLGWKGWRAASGRALSLCAIPALCLLAVIGATTANYGTLVRLRVQAAILIVPMAAVGVRPRSVIEQHGVPSYLQTRLIKRVDQ